LKLSYDEEISNAIICNPNQQKDSLANLIHADQSRTMSRELKTDDSIKYEKMMTRLKIWDESL
jgi:hypothetical protein